MRTTALSKFCDSLMEAGWLAALVIAPAFYNIFSSRVFEPEKVALLRTLALIVLSAWAIQAGEIHAWQTPPIRPLREWTFQHLPFFWPVALLVAANLLATLLSVTPRASIWGSYERAQGFYTLLTYLTFFGVVAANLRRREQIERLLTTVSLTAFAVSAYGLVQKLNLDPLPWGAQTSQFISGSLGDSAFLAAYLVVAVPITTLRLVEALSALMQRQAYPARNAVNALLYLVLLATSLAAIYYSGSRGAWLGLLAGLLVAGFLATVLLKRRLVTGGVFTVAALGLAFLGLLNLPNGPLQTLRTGTNLGRLGHLFEADDTSRLRILIWQGAGQMAWPHAPLTYPDGTPDALNLIRPLVGYGPESLPATFHPFAAPELVQAVKGIPAPNSTHNAVFDSLLTSGWLGLLACFALFATEVYFGLTWLGLLSSKDRWPYLSVFIIGSLVGAVGLVLWRGPAYWGLGLPLGALAGLFGYMAILAPARTLAPIDPWRASLLIALLGSLVAYFVETQFGSPSAATQLYDWVYVATLVVAGWAMRPATETIKSKGSAPGVAPSRDVRQSIFSAGILSLLLITLTYGFLSVQGAQTDLVTLIVHSFTSVSSQATVTAFAVPSLLGLVWLLGAWLLNTSLRQFALTLAGSFIVWVAFTIYQASVLVYITNQSQVDPTSVTSLPVFINLLPGYVVWLLGLLLAMAASQSIRQPQASRTPLARWAAAGVLSVGFLLVALFTNLQPIQANMVVKVANNFAAGRDYAKAVPLYRQALGFAPTEDRYFQFLAQAQINQAQTTTDITQRLGVYKLAIRNLTSAQRLNPLLPAPLISLAQTSQLAAQLAATQAEAANFADAANGYYAEAVRVDPDNADDWNAWARLNLTVRGDLAAALKQIQSSLAVDSQYGPTYAIYGDYWAVLGNNEPKAAIQQTDYQQAAANYSQALTLQPGAAALPTRLSLGQVQTALTQYDTAIATFDDLIQRAPDASNVWVVYNSLAKAYLGQGNKVKALENAFLAYNFAPDRPSKDQVQAFIDQVK